MGDDSLPSWTSRTIARANRSGTFRVLHEGLGYTLSLVIRALPELSFA